MDKGQGGESRLSVKHYAARDRLHILFVRGNVHFLTFVMTPDTLD